MTGAPEPAHRGLAWTGERALPWGDDLQVIYEHYHRYLLAAQWVANKDVLDLGSGEGYGADLLAGTASSVTGIDIAPEAVEHARRRYGRPGLRFALGSMIDADSVESDSCDVVVCFEALEHVLEHQELVAVARKALRPGGLFVTSTPERAAYNEERSGGGNPHHVRELDRLEFAELLQTSFDNVAILEQQIAVGSLVTTPSRSRTPQVLALARELDGWAGVAVPPAMYLLAVASDAALPDLPAVSVLIDPQIELVRAAQRERHEMQDQLRVSEGKLADAIAAADRRAADARANADVLRAELAASQREVLQARAQARDDAQRADDLRRRVDHLEGSRVYRAYRAVRAAYASMHAGP